MPPSLSGQPGVLFLWPGTGGAAFFDGLGLVASGAECLQVVDAVIVSADDVVDLERVAGRVVVVAASAGVVVSA